MIVIPPMTIDNTVLASSSIAEPYGGEAVLWVSGTNYSLTTRVYLTTTHKIYECVVAGVSTISPDVDIYNAVPHWAEVGSTNRYAMFDNYRNTPSTSTTGNITLVFNPSYRIDTLALLDLVNVNTATVKVTKAGSTYYSTASVSPSTMILTDLPPYSNTTITVVLSGSTATTMSVGTVILGMSENIGILQRNVTLDTINTSTVSRDIFGNVTLIPRRNIPRIECTTFLNSAAVTRVSTVRDSLNATPALWVGLENESGDEYYAPTIVLGFYRNFTINMDNSLASIITLELEEI